MIGKMNGGSLFFMSILAILGVVLIVVTAQGFNHIGSNCKNDKLASSLRAMMIMGCLSLALVFSYIVCHTRCSCASPSKFPWLDASIYAGIAVISLSTLVLSIKAKKGIEDDCGDEVLKNRLNIMLGVSVTMILILVIIIYIFVQDILKGKRGSYLEMKTEQTKKRISSIQKKVEKELNRRQKIEELKKLKEEENLLRQQELQLKSEKRNKNSMLEKEESSENKRTIALLGKDGRVKVKTDFQ